MLSTRKALAPIATIVLIAVVGIAGFVSFRHARADRAAQAVVHVRGIVGSEKQSFFEDPAVLAEFRKNGVDVQVTTEGSRQQATEATKDGADFWFPAGEPAGRAIAAKLGVSDASTPFYTPMVFASWTDIASILSANGVVKKMGPYWYVVDMPKMLALVESGTRWNQLPHNAEYRVGKTVLLNSSDVRKSNSAGMYLALASYVLNGNAIVTSAEQSRKLQPALNALFLRQGYQEASSAGPFDDYLTIGEGKEPLVVCYEQQFIEYLAATERPKRNSHMLVMYPQPTIFTKHTIVPTNEAGRRVAQLLADDVVLKAAEIRHGFRNADAAARADFWSRNAIDLPSQINDVIDPPSFAQMETMIHGVEQAYAQQ